MKKFLPIFCFFSFVVSVFAEPIAPKEIYFSQSKNANQPVEVPYKPPSEEELKAMETPEVSLDEDEARFDWSHVPYLPFKRVKLPLAKDPEL